MVPQIPQGYGMQCPPYQQPYQTYQQPYQTGYQPAYQQTQSRGRTVSSESDIQPAEVPMDGSLCAFPLADRSKVIVRWWDSSGVMQSLAYVPERTEPQEAAPDPLAAVNEKLDQIMAAVKGARKVAK